MLDIQIANLSQNLDLCARLKYMNSDEAKNFFFFFVFLLSLLAACLEPQFECIRGTRFLSFFKFLRALGPHQEPRVVAEQDRLMMCFARAVSHRLLVMITAAAQS